MDWIDFGALPWWGVLAAFVATFAVGAVWYSRFVLFPTWARLGELDEDKMKSAHMGLVFAQSIAGNVMGVVALAMLMVGLGATGIVDGLVLGAVVGLAFRGGAHLVHNGFAVRHWGVTLIDSAHDIVALAAAGAVLGAFA